MGRVSSAFYRNWCVWVVLFFSGGIKALVNSIEQPFTRSLISCDVPASTTEYVGSAWCGDRLRVIEEGLQLSAYGQSQENLSMLLVLGFVVIATGMWGPKLALKVGLAGVVTSVLLFMVACNTPTWARTLFIAGQFLQGIFPIDYLSSILMFYVAIQPGSDMEANMQLTTYSGLISGIVWNSGLSDIVQLLQVDNYFWIWSVVLLLNGSILLMTQFGFPDMRPSEPKGDDSEVGVQKLVLEMASYRQLFTDWIARRLLLKAFCEGMIFPFGRVSGGMMMAYHGWAPREMTVLFLVPQLLSLKAMPFYDVVQNKLGQYRTFVWSLRLSLLSHAVSALTLPYTDRWHLAITYFNPLLTGFYPKKGYVESRFITHEQNVRLQNVQWLLNYFLGTWVGPIYASMFDASVTEYTDRAVPGIICCGAVLLTYWAYFYGLHTADGIHGFSVSLRTLDHGLVTAMKLWGLVAYGPGPDIGIITKERSDMYQVEAILGINLEEQGGTIWNSEHFLGVVAGMNYSNEAGMEAVQKLEWAVAVAQSIWPYEERQKHIHSIWCYIGHTGTCEEHSFHTFKLEKLLGRTWEEIGEEPLDRARFEELLNELPREQAEARLAKCVDHANSWYEKWQREQEEAKRVIPKAPGRQHFLAWLGKLGACLMLSEAVVVGRGISNDLKHAVSGTVIWWLCRGQDQVAPWKAVLSCLLMLELGGVSWLTGYDVRPDLFNLVWLYFAVSVPVAVLRYFFELDVEDHEKSS